LKVSSVWARCCFRVQHRAQTEETFKLLFNAIHWSGMDDH